MSNSAHTYGNNNITLQNVQAGDINIYRDSDSPEIRDIKKDVAERIKELLHLLGSLEESGETPKQDSGDNDDFNFDDIDWDQLLGAIEYGSCVLFIGQGLATDKDNNLVHEQFFKKIDDSRIVYNEHDGFFMPGADKQIKIRAMKFYNNEFPKLNTIGYGRLQKLSQVPISLTISISPDDTMHRIYKKYNKPCKFEFFDGTRRELEEPNMETPTLYNLLGSPSANGKYIFTYEQFYEYINTRQEVKLPTTLETTVRDADHYIFLGIDFEKWYNRLLLFALNLDDSTESCALNHQNISGMNKNFIEKQFKVSFIDSHYDEFIDVLTQKCSKAGLYKSLNDSFIENSLRQVKKLNIKGIDASKAEELDSIKDSIEDLKAQVEQFKSSNNAE